MRELLRGALFFGLMVGGAPTMAAADLQSVSSAHMSPDACNTAGGIWAYPDGPGNPNGWCSFDVANPTSMDDWCEQTNTLANGMYFDAAIFGVGAFFGLPGFGPIGIGIGASAAGLDLAQFWNCSLGGW